MDIWYSMYEITPRDVEMTNKISVCWRYLSSLCIPQDILDYLYRINESERCITISCPNILSSALSQSSFPTTLCPILIYLLLDSISTTTEPELLSSKFVVLLVDASRRTTSATHFFQEYWNLHVANPLPEMDMYLLMRCNFRKRRTMPSILSNCSLGINFEQCTSTRVVNFPPFPAWFQKNFLASSCCCNAPWPSYKTEKVSVLKSKIDSFPSLWLTL